MVELKAQEDAIRKSRALELNVHAWPYGGKMLDAVLAPMVGEEDGEEGRYRNVM